MPSLRSTSRSHVSLAVLVTTCLSLASAQSEPSRIAPVELVRKTVQNEIKANGDAVHVMFKGSKTTPKGSTTKIYVETKEGTAGMVVALNGQPLTPEQRQAEEGRVERFLKNPEELRKKRKQEQDDTERTLRIMRALPDAFVYEYAGEEKGVEGLGKPGDSLVRLNFRPNPNYQPPSRVEQVLTGMRGNILIDEASDRIAKIDGTLFRDVSFGWGILGHLDKGGHFLVQQEQITPERWEVSRISLDFNGKILMFKGISIKSTEVYSDYKVVPASLTFAQALELMKKEEPKIAENSSVSKNAQKEAKAASEGKSNPSETLLPER